MKKRILIIILIAVLLIMAFIISFNLLKKEVDNNPEMLDSPVTIYKVDDDTTIYSYFKNNYIYLNGEKVALSEALEKNDTTIENIVSKLTVYGELNDGGSIIYVDNSNKIFVNSNTYIHVCKALLDSGNNYNIYISNNYEPYYCDLQ